jgi:hypothetical protein
VRAVRSVLWGPLAGGGEIRSQGGGSAPQGGGRGSGTSQPQVRHREGVVGGLQGSDPNCATGSMLRQGIRRGVMPSMGSQGWWVTPGERFVRR